MMKKITLIFFSVCFSFVALAQTDDTLNEGSNIQTYTPSALFGKGGFEINSFTNVYTQTAIRDREGNKVDINERQLFVTSLLQFTYGVSDKRRFNIGLDLNVNHAHYNPQGEGTSFNRTVISSIGPRIKWSPFAKIPRFSIQSSLTFPVASDLEGAESGRFVVWDKKTWWTQLFFDKNIGQHFQLFLGADLLMRFDDFNFEQDFFRTPVSAFISYFPSSKITFYGMVQHSPAFGKEGTLSDFGQIRWFTQAGVGGKYQLSDRLQFELSYTNFFQSRADGAGSTFNLGVRYIKR
ncbi:MAG: hypothetical protein ACPGJS_05275 [Flammeovirgaceae bacterium]